jgi:hypothetical protein
LRTESTAESNKLAAQASLVVSSDAAPAGQRATLSGAGWSMPVSIRAISASTSEADDREARRILGPGYVLDDDAEEWAAVIVTYGGRTRIASPFRQPTSSDS